MTRYSILFLLLAIGCRHIVMTSSVPASAGRGRLGYWLKRATHGDDIGFVVDGAVVALRPVEVHSADYALQEYGL